MGFANSARRQIRVGGLHPRVASRSDENATGQTAAGRSSTALANMDCPMCVSRWGHPGATRRDWDYDLVDTLGSSIDRPDDVDCHGVPHRLPRKPKYSGQSYSFRFGGIRRLWALGGCSTLSTHQIGCIVRHMDNKTVPSTTDSDVKRFDRWAATYDQSVMQRLYFGPVHSKMLDLLAQDGPNDPPSCVIDVGCGTGRLLRAASVRWPQAKLFGVDPAEQMVSEANRLNPNAIFKLASAESLPFPDQTADIVLSSLSFHHWADQKKALQEIARVLRPGGLFCLADHTMLLTKLLGEKVKSRDQIRELIIGAGLAVRQQQRLGMRFVLITLAQK